MITKEQEAELLRIICQCETKYYEYKHHYEAGSDIEYPPNAYTFARERLTAFLKELTDETK